MIPLYYTSSNKSDLQKLVDTGVLRKENRMILCYRMFSWKKANYFVEYKPF